MDGSLHFALPVFCPYHADAQRVRRKQESRVVLQHVHKLEIIRAIVAVS